MTKAQKQNNYGLYRASGVTARDPAGTTSSRAGSGTSVTRSAAAGRFVDAVTRRAQSLDLEEIERHAGSMDKVLDLMLSALPNVNALDDTVGPFRDTSNLRTYLGLTRQGIDERVNAGTLLCVLSGDNHRMYPAFQFDADRQNLPRLREILDTLGADRKNAWGAAIWLNHANDDLGGRTPADVLRSTDTDLVMRLARRAGQAFAA